MKRVHLYLLSGAMVTSLLFGMSSPAYARNREAAEDERIIHHIFEEDTDKETPVVSGKVVVIEGDMVVIRSDQGVDYLIDMTQVNTGNPGGVVQPLKAGMHVQVYGKLLEIVKH